MAAHTSTNRQTVSPRTMVAEIRCHHWKPAETLCRGGSTCRGVKRGIGAPRGLSRLISVADQWGKGRELRSAERLENCGENSGAQCRELCATVSIIGRWHLAWGKHRECIGTVSENQRRTVRVENCAPLRVENCRTVRVGNLTAQTVENCERLRVENCAPLSVENAHRVKSAELCAAKSAELCAAKCRELPIRIRTANGCRYGYVPARGSDTDTYRRRCRYGYGSLMISGTYRSDRIDKQNLCYEMLRNVTIENDFHFQKKSP